MSAELSEIDERSAAILAGRPSTYQERTLDAINHFGQRWLLEK